MRYIFIIIAAAMLSCNKGQVKREPVSAQPDTTILPQIAAVSVPDTIVPDDPTAYPIKTGIVTPGELVTFAQTLRGVPYEYACSDPAKGFDCSGFINYVFNQFYIK